ncbi:NAD(+) salvage pathway protein [Schaereria dolodes]|nr:NAD(+) salvage pathway protein [Schaereria dolodes]
MANEMKVFKPALLVVDVQEDFCPPNGSLAVPGGRDITPLINDLLSAPFALKIGTKESHPEGHISFDTSHSPPNNRAFESFAVMTNPLNPSQTKPVQLWPVHCVNGTPGAEIIPEIEIPKLDFIVEKARDKRVEMFSGFADAFGNKTDSASLNLAAKLKESDITHVYVVGLTGDCCVKCTALDAKQEGFEAYVIGEATRSVDQGEKGWGSAVKEFKEAGIEVIRFEGPEVKRVKDLSRET